MSAYMWEMPAFIVRLASFAKEQDMTQDEVIEMGLGSMRKAKVVFKGVMGRNMRPIDDVFFSIQLRGARKLITK